MTDQQKPLSAEDRRDLMSALDAAGLSDMYGRFVDMEQRLAAAEAEKQRIVEMFIKEMCIVNPHSSVVCSRGIKGCVMQHTHLQAAEADQQRAVDAALESVRAQLQALALKCGWDTNSSAYAADQMLAEAIGTNPLASN